MRDCIWLMIEKNGDVANLVMIGTPNAGSELADLIDARSPLKLAVYDLLTTVPVTQVENNPNTEYHTIASNWKSVYWPTIDQMISIVPHLYTGLILKAGICLLFNITEEKNLDSELGVPVMDSCQLIVLRSRDSLNLLDAQITVIENTCFTPRRIQ